MVLNILKVTAYVKIPAPRNTLAQKHVTKISLFLPRPLHSVRKIQLPNVTYCYLWTLSD
jgi:hypothetical protein